MPRESQENKRKRAARIVNKLRQAYPDACCTLDFESPFQLLVATVLAAQCTDAKVNTVTPELFRRWPTPEAMASADHDELEKIIHPLGFFRQKTRSLLEMSRDIVTKYDGQVPETLPELTSLRGVGRKTANVVLGTCFTGGGVIVDTHCKRISKRLGLVKSDDPTHIEFELMKILDPADWSIYGHLMVWHGRAVCIARKPDCINCPVLSLCPEGCKRLGLKVETVPQTADLGMAGAV